MRFMALAVPFAILVACVGDDPTPTVGNGPSSGVDAGSGADTGAPSDSGADGSVTELPRIDQYDVFIQNVSGTTGLSCVTAAADAVKRMGNGYEPASASDSSASVAVRPGALVFTHCAENFTGTHITAAAYGLAGAIGAQTDSARLHSFIRRGSASGTTSAEKTNAPTLRFADGSARPVASLDQIQCQQAAKAALDSTFASTDNRWVETKQTQNGEPFLAIGGGAGVTASVSCLGDAVDAVLFHIVALEGARAPGDVLSAIRNALSGTIQ